MCKCQQVIEFPVFDSLRRELSKRYKFTFIHIEMVAETMKVDKISQEGVSYIIKG